MEALKWNNMDLEMDGMECFYQKLILMNLKERYYQNLLRKAKDYKYVTI